MDKTFTYDLKTTIGEATGTLLASDEAAATEALQAQYTGNFTSSDEQGNPLDITVEITSLNLTEVNGN